MTSRAATFIDYNNTPASEQSIYFDAPVMIWNKNSSDALSTATAGGDAKPPSPSRFQEHLPGAFETDEDAPLTAGAAEVSRKPSVGIARDPIIRRSPSDGSEDAIAEEEADGEDEEDIPRSKGSHRRFTSDSGYGSMSNGEPTRSRTPQSMEPIPILWTDSPRAHNQRALAGEDHDNASARDSPFKRASSLRSFRSGTRGSAADRDERASVKTAPSGATLDGRSSAMPRRRASISGGSFASGPGTVGPSASAVIDAGFHARTRSAELGMTEKQKSKLSKSEIKEGKKMAKIIIAEGKAEKKALDDALKELADMQRMQKTAVKEESKAYTLYSKSLREFRKTEFEFFAARARYERAQADLQAHEDARDASRSHARETTEMLQEKNREVEWLRAQKAVDDREREAKVRQLTGKA